MPTNTSSTRQPPGSPGSTRALTMRTTPEITKYTPSNNAAKASVLFGTNNSAAPKAMAATPTTP